MQVIFAASLARRAGAVRRLRREAARTSETAESGNVGQEEKGGGGMMMRCTGTRLLLAVTSLYCTLLFCLRVLGWQVALTGPKTHPIRTKCVV